MSRLWCIITRRHDWRDAGDRYQACHRCPEIKRLPRAIHDPCCAIEYGYNACTCAGVTR